MSIEEKIAQIKDKAAKLAVKALAVTTLMGTGAVSSCGNRAENEAANESKDKIENVNKRDKTDETKTSVVFRSTHTEDHSSLKTRLLMENGDEFLVSGKHNFLEPGDTLTYETEIVNRRPRGTIKAARYKGNAEVKKKVDFGKIGKIGKDITD